MRLFALAFLFFGVLLLQSSCTTGTSNGEAAGAGIGALINNSMSQIQAPLSGSGTGETSNDPRVSEDGLRYYGPL
ncbi:MAG: hypothetical protein AAF491_07435 [Verrucomicrobiota bacterium]